jgi:multidrug efflux pump subunit AcrA (membrane-fusion protein)
MKKRIIISRKIRWLLVGIVILAIAGGATFYYVSSTQASTPTETSVQTATATRGSIVLYANGTGTLAPANEVSFGFGTSGQITELNVKIGETVEAGQVIGKIDDAEVRAAYEQAKRNLADLTTPAALRSQAGGGRGEVGIYNGKIGISDQLRCYYWEGKSQQPRQRQSRAGRWRSSRPLNRKRKSMGQRGS